MKKSVLLIAVCIALVSAFGACKDKPKEEASPATPHSPMSPGVMMPKGETKVVVPDNVKAQWNAVVIGIEDKTANKTDDVTINLGGEYNIPNSNLKVKVGDYLPDFKMDGLTITSVTDQPNNPAVHVNVLEGDKEVFKGWLYSKFPSIHPFQHDKYGLTLKDAVKTGKKG